MELTKPMVCKSTLIMNMGLVKKFDSLMDELREDKVPTPHHALMSMGWSKRKKCSVSYISKGLTCLKYHPNLQEEYNYIATHPDIRNALANLLQTEDNRIPLMENAVTHQRATGKKDCGQQVFCSSIHQGKCDRQQAHCQTLSWTPAMVQHIGLCGKEKMAQISTNVGV